MQRQPSTREVDPADFQKQFCMEIGEWAKKVAGDRQRGATLEELLAAIDTAMSLSGTNDPRIGVIFKGVAREVYWNPTWTPQYAFIYSYGKCWRGTPR